MPPELVAAFAEEELDRDVLDGHGSGRHRDCFPPADPDHGLPHALGFVGAWTRREDDCLVAVNEDAVVDMSVHCVRQNLAFHVTADRDIIVRRLRMSDAGNILLYDRAFIEVFRYVMRGRADQFYAALERLLVGVGSLERRQE